MPRERPAFMRRLSVAMPTYSIPSPFTLIEVVYARGPGHS